MTTSTTPAIENAYVQELQKLDRCEHRLRADIESFSASRSRAAFPSAPPGESGDPGRHRLPDDHPDQAGNSVAAH